MTEVESSGWVSVRCLFRWLGESEQVHEERITVWRTADVQEAIARAEAEAHTYAEGSSQEYLGLAQAYLLADAVVDGAEGFSLLRAHPADPAGYLDAFFDTGAERQQVHDEG